MQMKIFENQNYDQPSFSHIRMFTSTDEAAQSDSQIQSQSSSNKKKSLNPVETKNIPKNIGTMLKNHIEIHHKELCKSLKNSQHKDDLVLKQFLQKKTYTRKDFQELLHNKTAARISRNYFSSFQILEDILQSEKISDIGIHLKYIKKFFIATLDPDSIQILKLPDRFN